MPELDPSDMLVGPDGQIMPMPMPLGVTLGDATVAGQPAVVMDISTVVGRFRFFFPKDEAASVGRQLIEKGTGITVAPPGAVAPMGSGMMTNR